MSPGDNLKQSSWFFSEEFLKPLDPNILLIQKEARGTGHKIILRFQNGFGVEIRPTTGGEVTVFKVFVLEFLGSRMKDRKRLPYSAMPKMNWANNYEKLILFCQQVASQGVPLFGSSPWVKAATLLPIRSLLASGVPDGMAFTNLPLKLIKSNHRRQTSSDGEGLTLPLT